MKKNMAARLLTGVLLLTMLLTVYAIPAAAADNGGQYTVTFDVDLNNNLALARYGVKVYVDGIELGVLDQGGRTIRILQLSEGVHSMKIVPVKAGVPEMVFDFYVSGSMTVTSTLQTHRKYVNVKSMSVQYAGGKELRFRDNDGTAAWMEFALKLIPYLIASGT